MLGKLQRIHAYTHVRKRLALFLLCAPVLWGQPGPRNLTFDKFDPNGVPEGWKVWNFGHKESEYVQLRQEGCRSSGACLSVRTHLEQSFLAADFGGRAVRVTGWLKSTFVRLGHAQISLAALNLKTRVRPAAEIPDETVDGWQHVERILYVDPEDWLVEIDLDGQGLFEGLTFEVLPDHNGAPPAAVRESYRSLDRWISEGRYAQISSVLFQEPGSNSKPFATRAGLKALTTGGVSLESGTSVVSVVAARDDSVLVHARCDLKRTSSDRTYQYLLDYFDLWIRRADTWKLFDSAPLRVHDGRPEESKAAAPASAHKPGNLSGLCGLKGRPGLDLHLGPTDFQERLRPAGELKALMLFVEFSDAIHDEKAEQVYDVLVPESARSVARLSHGTASLKVDTDFQWRAMPGPAADYSKTCQSYPSNFTRDALIAAKNAGVHVSGYDLYYIVSTRKASLRTCALVPPPGKTIDAGEGGQRVHVAVFGGPESRDLPLLHETGHLFGLPDLYEYQHQFKADELKAWDLMAKPDYPLLTAWNRAKLGWIHSDQLQCVDDGVQTLTLTPAAEPDGLKAIAIPVGPSRAYVVELRELVGVDVHIPEEALLLYTVDASIPSGEEPMSIVAKLHLTDPKPVFEQDGVRIELLQAALGRYTVRVSRNSVPH